MNEKRADELRAIIRELQSPIEADRIPQVTALAVERIRELWMQVEKYEADIAELKASCLVTSGK
jgi:hypothetical protein